MYAVAIAIVISVFMVGVVVIGFPIGGDNFVVEDGPFTGIAVEQEPSGFPSQVFTLATGSRLEVYDRQEPAIAPIVLLRKSDTTVQWCIRATGHEGPRVASIRFHGYDEQYESPTALKGTV